MNNVCVIMYCMSPAFIILEEELPAVLSLAATLMY